jgi:small subunit ribosomal protein S11
MVEEKPPEAPVKAEEAPKAEVKPEVKEEIRKPRKIRLAVVHVYSSKNDTIITATDVSGAETLAWASGGMMVKSHREEGRPYAAMQAALKVVNSLKDKGITHVHVKIRAPGGVGMKTPGAGAQAVVRTIARTGVRIGRIEDVTPLPTDSMKRKGGRRGRRV